MPDIPHTKPRTPTHKLETVFRIASIDDNGPTIAVSLTEDRAGVRIADRSPKGQATDEFVLPLGLATLLCECLEVILQGPQPHPDHA